MLETDFSNIAASELGFRRIDLSAELAAWEQQLSGAVGELYGQAADEDGMLGWIRLPEQPVELEEVEQLAGSLRSRFTDLVVLGIGGSSLGALAVISALQHPYRQLQQDGDGLRVHFIDNVDADQMNALLEVLDPATTLVNVISKSGTTAETMAAYLIMRNWLEQALGSAYSAQVIATTDPHSGILRPLAQQQGYRLLSVPANVGGRFSVLSPVGLLPIALAGIDVRALLSGAARSNETVSRPVHDNPIMQAALSQYLSYRAGRNISVLMPYSSRLDRLTDWFVQLWAESLGKARDRRGSLVNVGSTPLGAVGATDQHSQVQLFNEGPDDKLVAFIRIAAPDRQLSIPAVTPPVSALGYLEGRSVSELLLAEQAATAHALLQHGKPSYTITLPRLDAGTLGELLQFLMWQTAVMGELLNINTYDQPGVELGKEYTYALMGREGFEEVRGRLEAAGVLKEERG